MNMYIGTNISIGEIKPAMPSLLRSDLHSTFSGGSMPPIPSENDLHVKPKSDYFFSFLDLKKSIILLQNLQITSRCKKY